MTAHPIYILTYIPLLIESNQKLIEKSQKKKQKNKILPLLYIITRKSFQIPYDVAIRCNFIQTTGLY